MTALVTDLQAYLVFGVPVFGVPVGAALCVLLWSVWRG